MKKVAVLVRVSKKCNLQAKSSLLPVSRNEILFEHSRTHLFVHDCLWTMTAELSHCEREHVASEAEYIYYLAFTEKVCPLLLL